MGLHSLIDYGKEDEPVESGFCQWEFFVGDHNFDDSEDPKGVLNSGQRKSYAHRPIIIRCLVL
jgi:hypothetical protein